MKGHSMGRTYEYKFVRVGEYAGSALFGVRDKDRNADEGIVHEHARDGWRLVQIFALGRRCVRRGEVLRADPGAGDARQRGAVDDGTRRGACRDLTSG